MNKQSKPTLSAIFMFVMAACAGFSAHADDTEIFFGGISSTHKSNVLFILDTSGSMVIQNSNYPDNTPVTRLDRMKTAFQSLLAGMNNVNVGLMRFSAPGGPVLYPVRDIDSLTESVSTISSRVLSYDSDAEQLVTDGSVILDRPTLTMTSGPGVVTAEVNSSNDDAEEQVSTGTVNTISSPSLEIPYDNNTISDTMEHQIGMIFRGLEIPDGATIKSATIEFEVNANSGGDYLDPVELEILGQLPGSIANFASQNIASRTKTSVAAPWSVVTSPAVGQTMQSADFTDVVQEIIDDSNWAEGGDIAVFIRRAALDGKDGYRDFSSYDEGTPPKLTVTFDHPATTAKRIVGLRFSDVRIPSDVKVTNATLTFTAATSDASPSPSTNLTIRGEDSGNSVPFTTALNDISSRSPTSASVSWSPKSWTADNVYTTLEDGADVTSIVQEIVNRSDWCGGNNMGFSIEGTGTRYAKSFDGDTSAAPTLTITFDVSDLANNEGCKNVDLSYQVNGDDDDAAQQTSSSKEFKLNENDLWLQHYIATETKCVRRYWWGGCREWNTQVVDDYDQAVGVRFTNVEIEPNAKITNAYIEFTASQDDSSAMNTLTIAAEDNSNSNSFKDAKDYKVLDRNLFASPVSWSGIPSWTTNGLYRTPNIASQVQKVVNRTGWASGNAMTFVIKGSGNGFRRAYSRNSSSSKAPRLVISTESYGLKNSGITVRDEISSTVDQLTGGGGTPIVDVLYEAVAYYRGDSVDWGKVRGYDPYNAWSGTNLRTYDDLDDSRKYYRLSHAGSYTGGTVVRPNGCSETNLSDKDCVDSYIDGSPKYISPITDVCSTNHIVLLTDGEPTTNYSAGKIKSLIGKATCEQTNAKECAYELAEFINTKDQSSLPEDNTIKLHTIAFNADDQIDFLTNLATKGGGYAKSAASSDELLQAFKEILTETDLTDTTFVSPGVTVNTFNRLTHRNELYFALFKPESTPSWPGNLKRYQINSSGEVLDTSSPQIVAIDEDTGFFKDSAKSWWSNSPDGNDASAGGAASKLPGYATRNMYTYYSASSSKDLSNSENAFSPDNALITKDMLGINAYDDEYRTDLMNWFLGKDVKDQDQDSVIDEDRKRMADPLHSVPHLVTYGGSDANPDITVFYGDNEGLLHAINADTGVEIFSFIPEDLLVNIDKVYTNSNTQAHPYGLDGSVNSWVYDKNGDSTIDPDDGDHVYIYFGMRRGGRNYYALDVTKRTDPKLLWQIEGGNDKFAELGQTWARPVKTKIMIGTTKRDVIVFSGGYDPDQDDAAVITADNQGRAIYIVDAKTGALIWNADASTFADMDYSIPGDVRVVDVDGDGFADQMYAGDVGGQVWRFDIDNGASSAAKLVTGGVIADISGNSEADARRFYHSPDVAVIIENNTRKLAISIGSGYHAHPLNPTINDRFYMIKQTAVYKAPDNGVYVKLTESDLYDATENDVQSSDSSTSSKALEDLKAKDGWYIRLEANAEKVLSTPLTVSGIIYFTTYSPEATTITNCAVRNGTSRLYRVNALDASSLTDNTSGSVSKTAREQTVPTVGIAGDPVRLRITDSAGTKDIVCVGPYCEQVEGDINIMKTYWYTK